MSKHVLAGQEHALQVEVADPVTALLGGRDRTIPTLLWHHVVKAGEAQMKASLPVTL
jgi:hypothetical protein